MDLRSGHPYWPIRDGLLATYPALRADIACDVVIIGAGITGALIAYTLSDEVIDTVVVDARDVAAGSTAASTALLQHATDTEILDLADRVGEKAAVQSYRLGLAAIAKIAAILRDLNDDCGFERKASLYVASAKSHVARLRAEFEFREQHGFDVAFFSQADIQSRFEFSAPAAILSQGDGQIDAFRLCHRLLQRAAARSVRIFDRTKIADIAPKRSGILLKTETGHRITAHKVVFATGYESQKYLKQSIGKLHSTFAIITEPVERFPRWLDRCLIWETARPYCYLRSTDDNRILIGGKDTPFATAHRQNSLVKKKSMQLLHHLQRLFPNLQCDIAYSWAGTFGTTEDGLAYVGETPEWPHAYFAAGYGGNGITMSLTAAEIIRNLYLGHDDPNRRIFAFDR